MKEIEVQTEIVSSVSATTKQEIEVRDPCEWTWVEASIWTDRMLAALGNGVKGRKWYSLMDKVYSMETLMRSWWKVESNDGASGIDRVTIERFKTNSSQYLKELQEQLKNGSYQPMPVKRVYIEKGNGQFRPLGIPVIKDRVVQAALKMVMEPIFEMEFLDMSYGFRPERGCKDALREVNSLLKADYRWVVDADLKGYFDTIPHEPLIGLIKQKISDGQILALLDKFLKQRIVDGLECWEPTQGCPQGAVLSPLLANLYLHPLDKLMMENGFKIIRYADDFVTLCQTQEEAEKALVLIQQWTSSNGLTLHPSKTHLGNCMIPGQGFEFLGYRFENGRRTVRAKSLKSFKDKIRLKTKRTRGNSLYSVIHDINPILKGWFEYYKQAHLWIFNSIDGWIRRRLRAMLRKQMKRPGSGKGPNDHLRWPNKFFASKGLFSLHSAFVLASQSR